jgi:hypothetical protein
MDPTNGEIKEESHFQNYPTEHGWIYPMGSGPAITGKVYSAAITGFQCLKGYWNPYEFEKSPDIMDQVMQSRLSSPGSQIGGSDVYKFIEGLSKFHPVNQCECFYFRRGINILDFTLEDIQSTVNEIARDFDLNLPICIPINFGSYGLLERNHIANIMIWNNVVDYYDPKGVLSKYKILKDSQPLTKMLEFLRDKFTENGNIVENPYPHQFDIHNCGVFICYRIYSIVILGNLIGSMEKKGPTLQEIQKFREVINNIACTSNN